MAPTSSTGLTLRLTLAPTCIRDEVRFDVRIMQRVPYEGVSRMQTSLRRRHRDRVVRRFEASPSNQHCTPSPFAAGSHNPRPCCAVASPSSSRATSTPRTPAASTSRTESPTPQTQTLLQTPTDVTIAVRRAHLDPLLRPGDLQLNALRLKPLTCPMPPPQGWPHSRSSCFVRAVDALYAYLTCGNYDFNYGEDGPHALPASSALVPYAQSRPCPDRAQTAARTCARGARSARP